MLLMMLMTTIVLLLLMMLPSLSTLASESDGANADEGTKREGEKRWAAWELNTLELVGFPKNVPFLWATGSARIVRSVYHTHTTTHSKQKNMDFTMISQ